MVYGADVFQHERRQERLRRIALPYRRHSLFRVVAAARRGRDARLVVCLGGAAIIAGHAIGGRDNRGIAATAVVLVVGSIAIAHVALLTRFDLDDVVLGRRWHRSHSRLRSARRQRRRLSAIAITGTGRRHDLKHEYVGVVIVMSPF